MKEQKKEDDVYLIRLCKLWVPREEVHVWMSALHISVNLFNDFRVLGIYQKKKVGDQ